MDFKLVFERLLTAFKEHDIKYALMGVIPPLQLGGAQGYKLIMLLALVNEIQVLYNFKKEKL